jgi:hypothetical protein
MLKCFLKIVFNLKAWELRFKLEGKKEQTTKLKYKPLYEKLLPYVISMTVLAYQAPGAAFIIRRAIPPKPWP